MLHWHQVITMCEHLWLHPGEYNQTWAVIWSILWFPWKQDGVNCQSHPDWSYYSRWIFTDWEQNLAALPMILLEFPWTNTRVLLTALTRHFHNDSRVWAPLLTANVSVQGIVDNVRLFCCCFYSKLINNSLYSQN